MSPDYIRLGQPHRHDPPGRATGRLACSAGEAARLTGVSCDLLDDQMRRGNLACITAGRRRLITAHRLQQFLGLGSQDTTSVRPATGNRAGHGQRPQ